MSHEEADRIAGKALREIAEAKSRIKELQLTAEGWAMHLEATARALRNADPSIELETSLLAKPDDIRSLIREIDEQRARLAANERLIRDYTRD
jgi:hypothetical protein